MFRAFPQNPGRHAAASLLSVRNLTGPLLLAAVAASAQAQQFLSASLDLRNSAGPSAPAAAAPDPSLSRSQPLGNISGTVTDSNGATVPGARVTLVSDTSSNERTADSSVDGYFNLVGVVPGSFRLTVNAPGLAAYTNSVVLRRGENLELSEITLPIASTSTAMVVSASNTEVAEAQVKLAEKQRVLGFYPNFYASYVWNAAPLNTRQKFDLARKSFGDPITLVMTGAIAGIEQSDNGFSGYHQGATGYGKRFGAAYADNFTSTMLAGAVLPSILHQDPRYFVKGTGSIPARTLYAIASTVICRGDNGRWQPNYSGVLGGLASAGISNLYYPASDRHGALLTIKNSFTGTALGAISTVIQEFFLHRLTPNIPNYSAEVH